MFIVVDTDTLAKRLRYTMVIADPLDRMNEYKTIIPELKGKYKKSEWVAINTKTVLINL
jgi:hypothetical protein